MLPNEKYQFEIEYEQERDVFSEAMTLKRIYERTKNPELLEKLKKLELEISKDAEMSFRYAEENHERFLLVNQQLHKIRRNLLNML